MVLRIMAAKFIIRLDDACDTMETSKWKIIERILDQHSIKPVVGVIPNNCDPELFYEKKNKLFWDIIRNWQDKGWTIAMHGYQHLFHAVNRKKSIFPFYDRSEFSGLSLKEQRQKIRKSMRIFRNNSVEPLLWIAPAHSFDLSTLRALSHEAPFRIVSDGIAFKPYFFHGFNFIPQQLWDLRKKKFGVWTVCLHPSMMSDEALKKFEYDISSKFFEKKFITLADLNFSNEGKNYSGSLFSVYFWLRYYLKSTIKGK